MATNGGDDAASVDEGATGFGVGDEIEVAVSVAELDVAEGVKAFAFTFFANGQIDEALAEGGYGACKDGLFTALGGGEDAFDADVVADIE